MKPIIDLSILESIGAEDSLKHSKMPLNSREAEKTYKTLTDTRDTLQNRFFELQGNSAYQRRLKKCFREAYEFIDKYKCARTDEDWNRLADNLSPYNDPLTVDLIVAGINEIEREYKLYLSNKCT